MFETFWPNGFTPSVVAELIAAVLAVIYILLAMRESRYCWVAAFLNTTIYVVLFWRQALPMQAALNAYYVAMAIYGWFHWGNNSAQQTQQIHAWRWHHHLYALAAVLALTWLSVRLLSSQFSNELLWLDALVTWGSVVATLMLTRKVLENWLYFIVFDSFAIYLYYQSGLYPTVVLFCIYITLATRGFAEWRRRMNHHAAQPA